MTKDSDAVLNEIRDEYELLGSVDAQAWFDIHPDRRADIEGFIRALTGTLDLSGGDDLPPPPPDVASARAARLDELLREDAAMLDAREEAEIRHLLSAQRPRTQAVWQGRAELRAALYAWIVDVIAPTRTVTRVLVQKTANLWQGALTPGLPLEFVPNRFGPYDEKLERDGKRIGTEQRWIRTVGTHRLEPGERASEARSRIEDFLGDTSGAERLLEYLSGFDEWELEAWTTVYWCSRALAKQGAVVSVDSVKSAIGAVPLWAGKLLKPNFADARIAEALQRMVNLGLLSPGAVTLR